MGRGCGGSSVASLTSQIQAMQVSIAALATGALDMSTLTDLPVPTTQTPPIPTDQSTTSELGKRKAASIGPPVGGLKRKNHGGSISHLTIGNIQPSTGAQLLSSPVLVNALEMRSHTVSRLEEDSHADIHCAGKNCVILSATGLQCDVSPFHESYAPKTDA
jgi:hypothetical protein